MERAKCDHKNCHRSSQNRQKYCIRSLHTTIQSLAKYGGWEGDLEHQYLTYSHLVLTLLMQSDV